MHCTATFLEFTWLSYLDITLVPRLPIVQAELLVWFYQLHLVLFPDILAIIFSLSAGIKDAKLESGPDKESQI